jgi:hypothetical protein
MNCPADEGITTELSITQSLELAKKDTRERPNATLTCSERAIDTDSKLSVGGDVTDATSLPSAIRSRGETGMDDG